MIYVGKVQSVVKCNLWVTMYINMQLIGSARLVREVVISRPASLEHGIGSVRCVVV